MTIKVLVADDEEALRHLVCDIIKKEGYSVLEARNGQEALDLFFEVKDIDLLILDVMMPLVDGWEVLREVREHSEVPVLMLTALGDERHEIEGLRSGADDYVGKPFSYEVFVARLNALLRSVKKERLLEFVLGDLAIEQSSHRVRVAGLEVELNRKEYSLLLFLVKNKGHVLTREQIICSVWGYDFDGDPRTIDTHVKTLRSKLKTCGDFIQTVRGIGYRFEVIKNDDH